MVVFKFSFFFLFEEFWLENIDGCLFKFIDLEFKYFLINENLFIEFDFFTYFLDLGKFFFDVIFVFFFVELLFKMLVFFFFGCLKL